MSLHFHRTVHAVTLWSIAAVLLIHGAVFARSLQVPTNETNLEINEIRFDGNVSIASSELLRHITTRESPAFLNRFLYGISEQMGRKNEYYDAELLGKDLQTLRKFYYYDKGFLKSIVDTMTIVHHGNVDIVFTVNEGYRSIVDSIRLEGIVGVPWFAIEDIRNGALIQKGDPFDRFVMESEIARILHIMNIAGYPRARFLNDSSGAHQRNDNNFLVDLHFDLGKPYFWGSVDIHQELQPERDDITDDIIRQQLTFSPDDRFNQEEFTHSERNLNRLGIFDRAQITVDLVDSAARANALVDVRPRDKHELAPEVLVSDEFGDLNLGIGMSYTNRNFIGGARIFTTRLRFRTQTVGVFPDFFGTDTRSISNLDLTFELQQPYVFLNDIKGTWSFSFIRDKRQSYRETIIRNKIGFTDQFATFTTGFLDWTLERTSLRLNDGVSDTSNIIISDPTGTQGNLPSQFNSILSFTIQRDKSFPAFAPVRGFFHTATFDESGVLPLLLKRAQPDLSFTQFYRIILVGRWYLDLTEDGFAIFALKLKGGFEEKYGESRSDPTRLIPTSYRFYGGGGSSVRGWGARSLSAMGNPEFGGNLSLETCMELRTNIFRGLKNEVLNKLWIVTFVDAGNIWPEVGDAQFSTVAMAVGFGFRYDTFFGPFRLDWGTRLYDPREMPGRKWITQRPFQIGALHFGIGHAF